MFELKSDGESTISVEELKRRLDEGDGIFLLDVREADEYRICNLGGHLIPLGELPMRLKELDPARETVVLCHTGSRSYIAVKFLQRAGFTRVKNLSGGIDEWAEKIDPSVPRY